MNQSPAENQTLVKLLILAAITIAFTGCALVTPVPLETYNTSKTYKSNVCLQALGVPNDTANSNNHSKQQQQPNDIALAKQCARLAIFKYSGGQDSAASSGFWTDTVLITLGVATGASALFGGSTDLTHGLGLATATGAGIKTYVSAPQAAKIYQSGSTAAACVLGEISTVDNAYNNRKGANTGNSIKALLNALLAQSISKREKLSSTLKLGENAKAIHDYLAIESVNELIHIDQLVRSDLATGRPNIDSITKTIEQSGSKQSNAAATQQEAMTLLQQNKQLLQGNTTCVASNNNNCNQQTKKPTLLEIAQDLADLATNVVKEDANLGKCAAKVGST